MTPLIGLIIAITAGRLAPNVRALFTAVVALFVAAVAVQTWDIGESLGRNPASTVHEAGYWIVQVIILAVTLAVAYGVFALRARRAKAAGRSLERPAFTGRRGVVSTSLLGTLMVVVGVIFCLVMSVVRGGHGGGSGDIPVTGVAGLTIGAVLLVGLAVVTVRDRRSASRAAA